MFKALNTYLIAEFRAIIHRTERRSNEQAVGAGDCEGGDD